MGTKSDRNLPLTRVAEVAIKKAIKKIVRKTIYNPESAESLNDRRVIGGNPDGMLNFTKMKYEWALNLWDTMEGNTWFPKEVGMTADAKDYTLLSPHEKRMYDLILAQLIFMDSLQANNLMDNINPYITAPEINACLSRQSYEECLVGDTEVLTPDGWLRLDALTTDHKILQVDLNQKSSFVNPSRIVVNEFDGKLVHFNSVGMSQLVTPRHRMMYKDATGVNKEKLARDLHLGSPVHGFPTSTTKQGERELTIYERFLIALQVNGSLVSEDVDSADELGDCITCVFSLSSKRKLDRLKDILDLLDMPYTLSNNETLLTTNAPYVKILPRNFKDWLDLSTVTTDFAVEFIDELKHWCDWDEDQINYSYDTTVTEDMNSVQAVSVLSGMTNTHTTYISKNEHTEVHRLTFKRDQNYVSGESVKTKLVTFKGLVYCPTVETGFFIVRHNNKTSITGNCNHSKSYAVMVESISDQTDLIYGMWKTDKILRSKNDYIASVYEKLTGEVTDVKILLSLFANQILEGIYFYAGFAAMYALGKAGKMLGSTQMFRFIQRDEVTHLLLFQNMINSVRKERPDLFTKELEEEVREMFRTAVRLEAEWGIYITQGQILGFTDSLITQYIQYLADKRLEAVGYTAEYGVKHPIPWVDGYSSFNDQRSNFFESAVINYSKGSIDFDDF